VGWVRHALESEAGLLHTDAVLLPFGADLRLHTYGLLPGLLAYPLTGWLGVTGAYNVMLVAMLFLNGLAFYALAWSEVKQEIPALVAAVWVMLGMPILFHFRVGRPSFACLWIVMGAMLALRWLLARPSPFSSLALGAFLVAALLTDFQMVLYTAIWLGLYLIKSQLPTPKIQIRNLKSKIQNLQSPIANRQFLALLGALVVFALPFFLIFYPSLANSPAAAPGLSGMLTFSLRYWDFVTPFMVPLIYGYELLAGMVAAVVLFRWRGAYRFWLLAALFFYLLSLGPFLQPTRLPLPFAAFSLWPPLAQFRTPYRLTAPAVIGLGMVAAFVLAHLLPRLRSRPLLVAIVLVAVGGRLLFAVVHDPLIVQVYPSYPIYEEIAAEAGDFALLEVPFGVRSGLDAIGEGGEVLQYYQAVHGKRLLNGMIARLDPAVFEFYRQRPSLMLLSGAVVEEDELAIARDFAEVLQWSNSRYVLVHGRLLTPEQRERITAFLGRQPQLEYIGQEDELVIYRVK
jgi:hypothetical protein